MNEWHDFFLAQAGAAGVLTGLVLVSGFPSTCRRSSPTQAPACRAAEALVLLGVVLTASILLLVPGQTTRMLGADVLAMGLSAWGCVVAIQLLRLRSWGPLGPICAGPSCCGWP
jgi:hypothetical protein